MLVKLLLTLGVTYQCACGQETNGNNVALLLPTFFADKTIVEVSEYEGNDDFSTAQLVGAYPNAIVAIKGSQQGPADLDVYSFQKTSPTGGIAVNLRVDSENERSIQFCLFDSELNLLRRQGLRSSTSNRGVDAVVPLGKDQKRIFIVISVWEMGVAEVEPTTSFFDYTIHLQETEPLTSTAPSRKKVWLAFGGLEELGLAESSMLGIRRFDPDRISNRLSGSMPQVIESLVSDLRLILGDYDIEFQVYGSSAVIGDDDIIALIGGSNPEMNGTIRSIGLPDGSTRTAVLVFAENLASLEQFAFSPQQAARFLANVVAHEFGHVIGLDHTIEPGDAMSIFQTANRRFDYLGTFGRATLLPSISRVGFQDGRARLLAAIGPSLR